MDTARPIGEVIAEAAKLDLHEPYKIDANREIDVLYTPRDRRLTPLDVAEVQRRLDALHEHHCGIAGISLERIVLSLLPSGFLKIEMK